MAIITWEQVDARCGKDDNITITIKELSDGEPTGKQYSTRLHKDRPIDEFKALLREQILNDRAKSSKSVTFVKKLDFSDFENYLNK